MKRWKARRCSEALSQEGPDTDTQRSRQPNCSLSYLLWSDDKSLVLLPPERKTHPGIGAIFCECVNPASTRWINAIIGQTWRGENPFKARKAKQGPWLIHLANLRVMYECQGTLVRRGRGECLLAQGVGWMWGRGLRLQNCLVESFPSLLVPRHLSGQTNGGWMWKWQKDGLSAPGGKEGGRLCKGGGEMWLWSAGRQSERHHALPSRSQSVLVDYSTSWRLKSQYSF